MKNDDPARRSSFIWRRRVFKTVASKVADETIAAGLAELLEEEQVATIGDVIAYREIAPDELHVADLTLTRVSEDAIIARPVAISVLVAGFAGEQKNERSQPRRRDTALALPVINVVDIADAIVNAARLEGRHAGELLLGTSYVEAKFPKPASSCIFSPAEFFRRERRAAGEIFVRNARDSLAVIGLTIVEENVATRFSKAVEAQKSISSNSVELGDRLAHCFRR
jgi:hypothetical protein